MIQIRRRWALLTAAVFCCQSAAAATAPQKVIARIDLSKPFHLTPGATFTATQGPAVPDPAFGEGTQPGRIHLCVRVRPSASCAPDLDSSLKPDGGRWFSEVHYLYNAIVTHPRGLGAAPLLELRLGSFSGVSDQLEVAVFVAYMPSKRRFEVAFRETYAHNNNQEVRFVTSGPLKGDIISVQSPFGPPFSYIVTVSRLTPDYRYKRALSYRSATRYGDGNPLAVIDSEMPNILRRLGLWRPGQSLPRPAGRCPNPRLVKGALWC